MARGETLKTQREEHCVNAGDTLTFDSGGLGGLIEVLQKRGYAVVGPTLRDGAIVYDEIGSPADLPAGWTDEHAGGRYRVKPREDQALFGYTVGPHSWKKYLHPPLLTLLKAKRSESGFTVEDGEAPSRYAFLGVRSCELAAIAVQDRVFLGGPFVDRHYQARREGIFVVAVNCGQAGGTCFCASMGTGPRASQGFDLALTEILDGERHTFLVEVGSQQGAEVAAELPMRQASPADRQAATDATDRASAQMGRALETEGLKELLYRCYEHPHWDAVAQRCLACANCTMVCPTCFCTTVDDVSDLAGSEASRVRRWDSCFTLGFSYIHGGSLRTSGGARYRQWISHKLATWQDQFGSSGCVGCGRCITWCPVGIDITEEVRALRAAEAATSAHE
ncbi:MAG TPA: 4Fe-4S dicluster domain-containing protein [Vicinamibacteria bacterium]|nr:4Fe-4S dicluster domain-containing protein [Vicinamibacteria bacterium]